MAIHGFLATHGAGLLFIMVVGHTTTFWDGLGYQAMNGLQHGLPGAAEAAITDGLLWDHVCK